MYKIVFTESYEKRAKKFIKKHPEVISLYKKTLQVLELNQHHPSLRLHKLTGKLSDLHSISINISYRISLEFILENNEIILINVGSHNKVYG